MKTRLFFGITDSTRGQFVFFKPFSERRKRFVSKKFHICLSHLAHPHVETDLSFKTGDLSNKREFSALFTVRAGKADLPDQDREEREEKNNTQNEWARKIKKKKKKAG